jgi:uncharacterized membrane protein YgdD (TMEM256/DUF423 family)
VRPFGALGGALGFLAVALGAFGAHALKAKLTPELLAVYQTGVQYHLAHALALLALGLSGRGDDRRLRAAGWCFTGGVAIFSGSLYLLAVTGVRALGAITPIGGMCFLTGWALVTVAAIAHRG